jgi:putative hemolysin
MKFAFVLLIFTNVAFASCEEYTRFGVPQKICWRNELRAFVNARCESDCLAIRFVKEKHPVPKLRLTGGKNPASAKCEHLGIKVVVMKDSRGNEQSFCEFADGSLMDSNAVARSTR